MELSTEESDVAMEEVDDEDSGDNEDEDWNSGGKRRSPRKGKKSKLDSNSGGRQRRQQVSSIVEM